MRSKFLVCAAIAAAGASSWFVSAARAADAKGPNPKDGKKKAAELHADEKSMKKQLQWEDKVMGPDSKRAELDKIARAHAINEKAEKDKERQSALEAAAPAPKVAPVQARKADKAEVSLISKAQEKQERDEANRPHQISPQLETAAAQAPVKTAKPADDKFIDKLLREEDAPSKKRASANDKELESLLAGAREKEKPSGRKRADSIDALLKTADKGPAMPAPRAQSGGLPDWAKQPDIAPTAAPAPPPVAVKVATKNTGVIQVVQGAAGAAPSVVQARSAPVASRPGSSSSSSSRKNSSKTPVTWSDPFADKKTVASYTAAPKKEPASRPSAAPSGTWNDPFADQDDTRKPVRRATPSPASSAPTSAPRRNDKLDKSEPSAHPAGSAGWKDPFTKAPTEPARTPVAMRELGKGESSKWEIASRHSAPRAASDTHAASSWGVIKKRAR
jgi:hypothetical protein